MSFDDVLRVTAQKGWRIQVEKQLTFRFAKFDSPDKIAKAVRSSTKEYLRYVKYPAYALKPSMVRLGICEGRFHGFY
jgi:hypothetical protein